MRYRKDIHDFLKKEDPQAFTLDGYKRSSRPYEQDGDLYLANFNDKGTIEFYTSFSLYSHDGSPLQKKVADTFHVKTCPLDEIVCRCGDKNSFSAYYGSYCLMLRCQCRNEFSAYSG